MIKTRPSTRLGTIRDMCSTMAGDLARMMEDETDADARTYMAETAKSLQEEARGSARIALREHEGAT